MFEKLSYALDLALDKGADKAEVFASKSISTRVNVRNLEVEEIKNAEDVGFSLRVIKDNSLGFAYSSEINTQNVEKIVEAAIETARFTAPDKNHVIAGNMNDTVVGDLNIYDEEICKLDIEQKINMAKDIERVTQQYEVIKKTEMISYSDHISEVFLANTEGFKDQYASTYCGGAAEVIAELDGTSPEAGFGIDYQTAIKKFNAEFIGHEAAQQAIQMLEGKQIQTQDLDVVFSPLVAIDFLEVITSMLCADNVLKGKSILVGRELEQIASSKISIVDNGCIPEAINSAPFDAEGTPTRETIVVDDGILKTFLYDNYNAKKAGQKSTGNGSRGGFSTPPSVDSTNMYFRPGIISEDDLLSSVDDGFYVTRLMGLHTANPISGDFSLGASGRMIRKGKLSEPVRGVAIAGNLLQLLQNVVDVADNLRFVLGSGAPTMHMGRLMVSGS